MCAWAKMTEALMFKRNWVHYILKHNIISFKLPWASVTLTVCHYYCSYFLLCRYCSYYAFLLHQPVEQFCLYTQTALDPFKAVTDKGVRGETEELSRKACTEMSVPASTHVKPETGFDPQALGQQFCQWFYQLLNSHNPSLGQQPQEWGPQHFWPDVRLRLLSR